MTYTSNPISLRLNKSLTWSNTWHYIENKKSLQAQSELSQFGELFKEFFPSARIEWVVRHSKNGNSVQLAGLYEGYRNFVIIKSHNWVYTFLIVQQAVSLEFEETSSSLAAQNNTMRGYGVTSISSASWKERVFSNWHRFSSRQLCGVSLGYNLRFSLSRLTAFADKFYLKSTFLNEQCSRLSKMHIYTQNECALHIADCCSYNLFEQYTFEMIHPMCWWSPYDEEVFIWAMRAWYIVTFRFDLAAIWLPAEEDLANLSEKQELNWLAFDDGSLEAIGYWGAAGAPASKGAYSVLEEVGSYYYKPLESPEENPDLELATAGPRVRDLFMNLNIKDYSIGHSWHDYRNTEATDITLQGEAYPMNGLPQRMKNYFAQEPMSPSKDIGIIYSDRYGKDERGRIVSYGPLDALDDTRFMWNHFQGLARLSWEFSASAMLSGGQGASPLYLVNRLGLSYLWNVEEQDKYVETRTWGYMDEAAHEVDKSTLGKGDYIIESTRFWLHSKFRTD